MSNLNSVFDIQAGIPPNGYSALQLEGVQKTGETPVLSEGHIVFIENTAGVGYFTKLTSARRQTAALAFNLPDVPWLIIQGMDQSDAVMSGKVVALKLNTGIIFKVASVIAFAVGDLVKATAGVLAAITPGVDNLAAGVNSSRAEQSFGVVLEKNAAAGWAIVAS
jgi:hypothetical protein